MITTILKHILVGKSEGRRLAGKPRHRENYSINMWFGFTNVHLSSTNIVHKLCQYGFVSATDEYETQCSMQIRRNILGTCIFQSGPQSSSAVLYLSSFQLTIYPPLSIHVNSLDCTAYYIIFINILLYTELKYLKKKTFVGQVILIVYTRLHYILVFEGSLCINITILLKRNKWKRS
jgi:hypothetical protein